MKHKQGTGTSELLESSIPVDQHSSPTLQDFGWLGVQQLDDIVRSLIATVELLLERVLHHHQSPPQVLQPPQVEHLNEVGHL